MKTIILRKFILSFALIIGMLSSANSQVQLLTPNGGENWVNGYPVSISWNNPGQLYYFTIEYSGDNGLNWFILTYIEGVPGFNQTGFITSNFNVTDQALIRISDYFNPFDFDVSDATFSVSNPAFSFYSPYSGQVFYQGSDVLVQWYSSVSNPVSVELSADNGLSWTLLASGITSSSYTFAAPEINSDSCLIKLSASNDPSISTVSLHFSIRSLPQITVVSPNGGEIWNYGENNSISWSGSNISYYVIIDYSTDGGFSWQNLGYSESSPTGGTAQLQMPIINTTSARIKISDPAFFAASDISDADFSFVVPPFFLYGVGSQFYTGQPFDITWNTFEPTEADVEISLDNGLTFQTIVENIPSNQTSVTVTAPLIATETGILKLVDSNDPSSYTLSEVFRIVEAPVITMINPVGGELWDIDSTYTVSWTFSGEVPDWSYFSVDYSTDNGQIWNNIGVYYYYLEQQNSIQWITPVVESDSCLIRVSDYFLPYINATSPSVFKLIDIPDLQICAVSVDSISGKNIVIWNKVESELVSEYVILKETNAANVYEEAGSIPANALSTFIDLSSNPREKATRYKLTFRDSDGNIYGSGLVHQTIHLSINQGVGSSWNLNWSPYLGFPVTSYNIYRGNDRGNMELINTVSGNFTSYTDFNAQPGFIYYMIEVINPNNCNPEGLKSGYGSSTSNIATNKTTSTDENIFTANLNVYPNPSTDYIQVKTAEFLKSEVTISIISSAGAVVETLKTDGNQLNSGYNITVSDLKPGIYYLRLTGSDRTGSVKFIKSE